MWNYFYLPINTLQIEVIINKLIELVTIYSSDDCAKKTDHMEL